MFPVLTVSIMKKQLIAVAALCALMSTTAMAQQAKEGPWLVRVRAVQLKSANTDATGLKLTINDKTLPEIDFSYYFSREWAAELVLTVPQEQDVRAGGTKIGTFKHLPPTLTVHYHVDAGALKPYVGAGINYTRISDVNILSGGATLDRNSIGAVLQAGLDIPFGNGLYFNVDVKKAYIHTDVSLGGANKGTFKIDPLLVGLGIGWRF